MCLTKIMLIIALRLKYNIYDKYQIFKIFYDNDMKEASQWKYCYGGDKNMSCSKKYE